MKEHAIEILETSSANTSGQQQQQQQHQSLTADPNNSSSILDNSDTMEELNRMISKFERLSKESSVVMVDSSGNNRTPSSSSASSKRPLPPGCDRLRLNNAVRETFAHRFAHMFLAFEHFVIFSPSSGGGGSDSAVELGEDDEEDPSDDLGMPLRPDTFQNFDKTSFLSDQKQSHLPFLTSFLETQTFSSFVDEYIQKCESDSSEGFSSTSFGVRLNALKGKNFLENLVSSLFMCFSPLQNAMANL